MKTWLLAIFLVLVSCGHHVDLMTDYHFYVVVRNYDTLPCHAKITTWYNSVIYEWDIPGGTEFGFDLGCGTPDGFELETTAFKTAWLSTDYRDCNVFIVNYPYCTTDKKYLRY